MQLAGGFVGCDISLGLSQDLAGVHFFGQCDYADAGRGFAVNYRPVNRGGSAVFRKQRGVDIDRAFRRQISQFITDLLAERNYHNQVRLITGYLFDDLGSIDVICLDKRY